MDRRLSAFICGFISLILLSGCASAPRNWNAIHAYYRYDFTASREALRGEAMLMNNEQVLLNNARLGIAALADGDLHEAEIAMGRSFDLLSTAGLNRDRTTAAVLVHEGVRIWKGEPFEQAMMYHYVATLFALMGDWENARAAAANSIFRLTDFGEHQTPERLARRAAQDPQYLDRGYTAVDTDFALGFLMQAVAARRANMSGVNELLEDAVRINPRLKDIADTIRAGDYDTLLIVDWGKGPTKIAYGPDDALAKFQRQEHVTAPLAVTLNGEQIVSAPIVADVGRMAIDHRWNNLEDIRRAKSAIGNVLLYGGAAATLIGAEHRSAEAALAGVGAMALGALTKAGARADTRYLEFLPHAVYVVPLKLGHYDGPIELRVGAERVRGSNIILPNFQPGTTQSPRVVYLRLHGPGSTMPGWLTATKPIYGNDFTGVAPGDLPWILGGTDVSTPTRQTLEAYQEGGHLTDMTVSGLRNLYEVEGILIGQGMERQDGQRNPSFRHILEGGTGLFTPHPYSMGYKRLMYTSRPPFRPKSEVVRNRAADTGVLVKRDRSPLLSGATK